MARRLYDERYGHVDALIVQAVCASTPMARRLYERYGHVDALIAQLGTTGSSAWYSDDDSSCSNSTYASSEACSIAPSSDTCAADDDFSCSAGDLAAARTMYVGVSQTPARKCEAHAYVWQEKKNYRNNAHLTSLVSALEPVDSGRLLQLALLAAGIAKGAVVPR